MVKLTMGFYHEHVMDLYEFKQPEKLLSDLTDSSATDSESCKNLFLVKKNEQK